jgi:hypothetical protein
MAAIGDNERALAAMHVRHVKENPKVAIERPLPPLLCLRLPAFESQQIRKPIDLIPARFEHLA